MFADGISTRDEATDMSGRGVGMAAVRAACRERGGDIHVNSHPGGGTSIELRFPHRAADDDQLAMMHSVAPSAAAES